MTGRAGPVPLGALHDAAEAGREVVKRARALTACQSIEDYRRWLLANPGNAAQAETFTRDGMTAYMAVLGAAQTLITDLIELAGPGADRAELVYQVAYLKTRAGDMRAQVGRALANPAADPSAVLRSIEHQLAELAA